MVTLVFVFAGILLGLTETVHVGDGGGVGVGVGVILFDAVIVVEQSPVSVCIFKV